MQRYMTHPYHGKMPVYSNSEIEANKRNGWKLEETEPAKVAAPSPSKNVSEASPEAEKEDGENTCPKCGKSFARGLTMHMKFCNAEAA